MASTSLPIETRTDAHSQVAPWWHTALLVVFLLVFSYLGKEGHQDLDHTRRMKLYIFTIVLEWLMVLFIAWGLRTGRVSSVRELIGGRWARFEDFLLDVAVGVGFWFASALVLAGLGFALGMNNMAHAKDMQQRIGSMLPDGALEICIWLLLSATAGFCEEVIFRGYFQRQFASALKNVWGGMIVQALIFGGSHAYEGWRQMIRIAVFGFMFALLAYYRKSLRPGMIAHFAQDGVAGALGRFALKYADKALPK